MLSKSLLPSSFALVAVAVVASVGEAFVVVPKSASTCGVALAATYGFQEDGPLGYSMPAKSTAVYHDDFETMSDRQELKKIMAMKEYEIENELRDKYGQVFCNNHFTRTHKQDLAEFLLEVRRTKKPVHYDDEMPEISDNAPGHWMNDKSGDFFRV
jgi:hypothetical protein